VKNGPFLLSDTSTEAVKREPRSPTRTNAASGPARARDECADRECDRAARCASCIEPYPDEPAPTGEHDAAPPRTARSVDAPDAADAAECADAAAEHDLENHEWDREHTCAGRHVRGDSGPQ
jgi:hypothetical protein